MREAFSIIGISIFIGLTTWLFFFIKRELKIDGCLDKGGRWNYKTNTCDTLSFKDRLDSFADKLGGEVVYETLNEETKKYINEGDTLVTNLYEFEYIGKVISNNKSFSIFSGRDCDACDANISIYIHNPKNGKFIVENGRDSYSYPRKLLYYLNNELISEERVFFGEVLNSVTGIIWYQKYLNKDSTWKESTYLLDLTMGTKKVVKFETIDSLQSTVRQLELGKCKEIEGETMTSQP